MGYYRGAPQADRRIRLDQVAATMRKFYLTHGKGCKTRLKVIQQRTAQQMEVQS